MSFNTGGKVYVRFPKTGLGNMLLVWANALVFAEINELELIIGSWWGIRPGTFLRGERKKRIYHHYFNETCFNKKLYGSFLLATRKHEQNPAIEKITTEKKSTNPIYLFDKAITHVNLFANLLPYRNFITQQLNNLLTDKRKQELAACSIPLMSVHIRRGDFKTTHQTTALSFFINAINACRQLAGEQIPVTVFSDAAPEELETVLSIPNVMLSPEKADILDILLMSKSKIIVLSQSSTFSYWAAFLSDAKVIMKHDEWQALVKPSSGNYEEIKWNDGNPDAESMLKNLLQS
jgi:hypothetical protein